MSRLTLLVNATLLTFALSVLSNARADSYADCNQTQSEPLRILSCALVIATPNETATNLGAAHAKLCTVWARHKDLTLAKLHCEAANAHLVQPENYLNLGSAKYENGLVGESVYDFAIAIGLNPDFSAAYYNRAVALEKLGDQAKALADYKEAARLGDVAAVAEVAKLTPLTASAQTKR